MDLENAQLARRNGKYKKALELYKLAVKEDPSNAEALAGLALTHIYLKQNDAALMRANEAIRVDANQPFAHIALASVYFSKGQKEQYKEEVERAFALNPFFYEVACTYAKMLFNDKKIDEAIPIFEKIIEANPERVCPHYLLGVVYTQKKLYQNAHREHIKAFRVQPTFFTALGVFSSFIAIHRIWWAILSGILSLFCIVELSTLNPTLANNLALVILEALFVGICLVGGTSSIRRGRVKTGLFIYLMGIWIGYYFYMVFRFSK